jgi:hypothetical protein
VIAAGRRILRPMELMAFAKSWLPALAAAVVLLSTCDPALIAVQENARPGTDAGKVEEALHGTWLREYEVDGTRTRRILTLGPRHEFSETVHSQDAKGRALHHEHQGTWFFDGTNLKRKYTSMNGEPPSRLRVPFATFEIAFESPEAFRGIDRIRGHEVRYRRVAPDALAHCAPQPPLPPC